MLLFNRLILNLLSASLLFTSISIAHSTGSTEAIPSSFYKSIAQSSNAEAFLKQGNARYTKKDFRGAIADYNEAIRLKPDDADPYYGRGLIKKERGEKQEALADFRKVAELFQQQGNTEWYNNSLDRIKELGG